jgi:hypothetical protein
MVVGCCEWLLIVAANPNIAVNVTTPRSVMKCDVRINTEECDSCGVIIIEQSLLFFKS